MSTPSSSVLARTRNLGVDLDARVEAFSSAVLCDTNAVQIYEGTSALYFTKSLIGTHVNGRVKRIIVRAGSALSVAFDPEMNQSGPAYDYAKDYYIEVGYYFGRIVTKTYSLLPLNVALSGGVVKDAAADKLKLTFTESVNVASVAGMTLDGTARSITGVDSGSGTSAVTFQLDGDVDPDDEITLDIAEENDITEVDGGANITLVEDYPITNEVVGAYVPSFGTDFTYNFVGDTVQATDNDGSNHGTFVGASVAIAADPAPGAPRGDCLYMAGARTNPDRVQTGVNSPVNSAWGFAGAFRIADFDGHNELLITDNNDDDILIRVSPSYIVVYVNGGASSFTALHSFSVDTWYQIAVDWDRTTLRVFVDGALIDSTTSFADISTASAMSLGGDINAFYTFDGFMKRVLFKSAAFTAGQLTELWANL